MNTAKLFEISRKIDEGYYTEGDIPDEVLDLMAARINAEETQGQPDPWMVLAACGVTLPIAGFLLIGLVKILF